MRKLKAMSAVIAFSSLIACSGTPTEAETYRIFTTAYNYDLGARLEIVLQNRTNKGFETAWCHLELQKAEEVNNWETVPTAGGCRDMGLYVPARSEVKTFMTLWDAVGDGFYRIVDTVRNVNSNTFSVGVPRGS